MRRILIERDDPERSIFEALRVLSDQVRVVRALRHERAAVLCVRDSDFWRACMMLGEAGLLSPNQ